MKMEDSAKSGASLEVSVSFGRFANDALSWEKWSSFSPNKYLEEVGSLSTPGSVAQKKAYFEAHYKKIAARKAEEELEQEQSTNPLIPTSYLLRKEDHIPNSSENGIESSLSSDEGLVEEVMEEACVTSLKNVAIADEEKDDSAGSSKEDDHVASMNDVANDVASVEEMSASIDVDSGISAVELTTSRKDVNVDNPELDVSIDALLGLLETPQKDSHRTKKEPSERKNGLKPSSVLKKENTKMNPKKLAQKVTPISKERSLPATRKKVVSSPAKPFPATTPRPTKPMSVSTPTSALQYLKKKVNNSAPPKVKSSEVVQSKRVAPTSLHMSLSLGPTDSLGAVPMRKSLIMESMGDKDIVKRAFKAFQNRTIGFATDEKPTTVKHAPSAACEPKTSGYHTPTKDTEGLRKDAEKRSSQRIQSGTRSNPLSSGLRKSTTLDKKSLKAVSPATGLRSDDKAEKRKEFIKKVGAKSIARDAEKAQKDAKSKMNLQGRVETEIRQQRPTLSR